MSWSIQLIGKPANVSAALTANSAKLDGQSKVEFDSALPHLVALANENFESDEQYTPLIRLEANGHGTSQGGEQKNRTFKCSIERIYGILV